LFIITEGLKMKKVLLATTALTLSAGFASADVSISGSAETGIHSTAGADHITYSGIDMNFAVSGASDNGMAFSTSVDMGSGHIRDGFDPLADAATDNDRQGTDFGDPTITIGMDGFTLAIGHTGANDNLYDDDLDGGGISVSGSAGDATFAVVTGLADADTTSASLGYSVGAVGVSAAMTDVGDVSSVTISYDMGDMGISVTSDDGTSSAEITYTAGSLSTTIEADDDSNWDVSLAYAAGAASVGFATDESDAWEATVGYDLGGGASFNAGVNEGETSYATVGFSF
jgi:outer membrane protein OmpU